MQQANFSDLRVVAETTYGLVEGRAEGGAAVYRGIPYAAAPVGDRRWRPPQPPEAWTGVLQAQEFGPICPQHDIPIAPFHLGSMSEDCLTVNVWGPLNAAASRLPVLVWISGGAFAAGAGSWPVYDGAKYIERDVVLVTLNYRVGRFGFFTHPALTPGELAEPVGNYGLMDVIAALGWVQANVAAFGGDPGNVTVAGHSAAGLMVAALMGVQAGRGLFNKVIILSATGLASPRVSLDLDHPERSLISPGDEAFAQSTQGDLRALAAADVLGPRPASGGLDGRNLLIDGRLLFEETLAPFCRNAQAKIPMIIGTTDRDLHCWIVKDFSDPPNLLPVSYWFEFPVALQSPTVLQAELGERASEYAALVAPICGEDWTRISELLQSDILDAATRLMARRTHRAGAETYVYRFTAVPSSLRPRSHGLPHAGELSYVFDSFASLPESVALKASADDSRLSSMVVDYFAAFARTGDPNAAGRPHWPAHESFDDVLEFAAEGPCRHETTTPERLAIAQWVIAKRLGLQVSDEVGDAGPGIEPKSSPELR